MDKKDLKDWQSVAPDAFWYLHGLFIKTYPNAFKMTVNLRKNEIYFIEPKTYKIISNK